LSELAERLAGAEARIAALEADRDNFKRWQEDQNGSIIRVDQKVDRLQFWIMGVAAGAALNFLTAIVTILITVFVKK